MRSGLLGYPKGRQLNAGLFGYPLGLPVQTRSQLATLGEITAISGPQSIAGSGSAHTKGDWQELEDSTPFAADGFIVRVLFAATSTRAFLLDLGLGGSGTSVDEVLLENALVETITNFAMHSEAYFPVPIPAGSRISARCQANATTGDVNMQVVLVRGGSYYSPLRLRRITTYGADTTDTGGTDIDPGASANTKGAWTSIGVTTGDADMLVLCSGRRGNTALSNARFLFDVGIGGSGDSVNEVIASDLAFWQDATADKNYPSWMTLPVRVRAGERLAMRAQSQTNDASDRLVEFVVLAAGR